MRSPPCYEVKLMRTRSAIFRLAAATFLTAARLATLALLTMGVALTTVLTSSAATAPVTAAAAAPTSAGDAKSPASRAAPLSDCDRLASHPEDPQRVGPGVERGDIDLPVAIAACERAAAADPATPRYSYQLARLLFYANQNERAVAEMRRAADTGYPQAQFVFGTFITRGRPGAPTDPCLAESYWKRSAAGGRQAARVQYLRYTLKGRFDACAGRAGDDEMLAMLEAATGEAKDFYEGLIVEDLGEALVARLAAPTPAPATPAGLVPLPAQPDARARDAWAKCLASRGAAATVPPRLRRFGETREASARLQALILSGEKTVTATSPWLYDADASQRPFEGGWSLLLDADGAPAAVLRTTSIRTLPFSAVTAEDSQYEGKPVRPIEAWRDVHRRYFDRMLAPLGRAWSVDMPVTLERFEVACRG
jgi:uncharacterized protein YhfF